MPLTEEQVKALKEQILSQVKQLPEDQQAQAQEYISGMNNEQLEEFLKKNQMAQEQQGQAEPGQPTPAGKPGGECIFCSIANKKIESLAIYEDKDYMASLEINPFSKGHTILIPKKHIKKTKSLPARALTIANKIGKHLVKRLKSESFQVTTNADMAHAIVNIIPTYKDKPITYQREQTKPEELQKLAIKIGEVIKKTKTTAKPKAPKLTKEQIQKSIIKLQRRIP